MITYKGIKRTYTNDKDLVKELIDYLKSNNFYDTNKEDTIALGEKIRAFLDTFTCTEEEVTLERKETEEEAVSYFGKDFINFYNDLLERMDKANVAVALHGTSIEIAPKIMEGGLKYSSPALLSTAIIQNMPFGSSNFSVNNFETLLNWPHRGYKHLVMLGIPYECFYKSGLWNHDENSQSRYELSYQIPSDFVIGFIDVENKTVIMNPKYKRNHDYSSLVPDMDVYHENPELTIDTFKENMRVSASEVSESPRYKYEVTDDIVITADNYISTLGGNAEDLLGILNSIYFNKDGISEEYYQDVVKALKKMLKAILKSQEFLLSKEELENLRKDGEAKMAAALAAGAESEFDVDFSWDDDISWDDGISEAR